MSEPIEKSPWPAQGIEPGTTAADYEWGYLTIYPNGRVEFVAEEQPTRDEIEARWGHYFR